ncbi:MAG TPA: hypothetical protein VJ732_03980, partial [Bryobacteraceae bacterium]|nr:hypothetical protein [Bryobacteraceae bacterium]
LLLPCYWQSRIQAGDLSSHIYNSWLAELVEGGHVHGLAVVRQSTNVLFDLLLSDLFRWMGADWAQRIAASIAVLVFVWGAFAFVSAVSERRAWPLLPAIAMLAYGWVFHMGFFNFYLALGLSFWAMALFWRPTGWRVAAATGVLAIACTAHALPVLWAGGLMAYTWVARRLRARARALLVTGAVALLAVAHFAVAHALVSVWSPIQLSLAIGADQVWVFDGKYYFIQAALVLVWGFFLLDLLHTRAGLDLISSIPFHLCALCAAAVCFLPTTVLIPGYRHALVYIAERMSLGTGICVCAMLGTGRLRAVGRYGLMALALAYFAFLFRDEQALNRFEDRVQAAVNQIPAGQRAVSPLIDPELRVNALTHMIDRACVGRCYSYANYEPSTAQFRIRAPGDNPYVTARYKDSWDLQNGKHVVQREELPLWQLEVTDEGRIGLRQLKAGVLNGSVLWNVLTNRKPKS